MHGSKQKHEHISPFTSFPYSHYNSKAVTSSAVKCAYGKLVSVLCTLCSCSVHQRITVGVFVPVCGPVSVFVCASTCKGGSSLQGLLN